MDLDDLCIIAGLETQLHLRQKIAREGQGVLLNLVDQLQLFGALAEPIAQQVAAP